MLTNISWKAIVILILLNKRDHETILSGEYGAFAAGMMRDERDEDVLDEDSRLPLYFLLLLMIPDSRGYAGWDAGPSLLAGARVALKEVNSRPAFLHGYRLELIESGHDACGVTSTSNVRGVINLVDYAINPLSSGVGPVVAVGGLMCSGPTTIISSVAGKPGIDLLQLSGSNSPIFVQDSTSYPYLWRFLTSASIFVDLLKHLMDRYNWTRVAVVYDSDSVYYNGIALNFLNDIKATDDKEVAAQVAITLTDNVFFDAAINSIKNNHVRVIFTFTNSFQTGKLLCMAKDEGLIYPTYQWVLTDDNIEFLTSTPACNEEKLLAGANNALATYFQLYQDSHKVLVSNGTYEDYEEKYHMEFEQIQDEYNATFSPDPEYAGIVYDQVWALAMALNTAIPILKKENLSIEGYSYGQPKITDILQQELSKVQFVGASSQVQFGANHELFSKVNIFRVQSNRSEKLVGEYDGHSQIPLIINLTGEEVPDDEWDPEPTLLPVFAAVSLLTVDVLVMLFVTLNLVLTIVYRNRPELKAISPYLSMLMFIGCYILCASALCDLILIGISIKENVFTVFCNLHYILLLNGVFLIFNTLFIRLLRVRKIFSIKNLTRMNKYVWNNYSLLAMIFILCLVPNVFLATWLSVNPISHATDIEYKFDGQSLTAQKVSYCMGENIALLVGSVSGFILLVAFLIVMLAINTRNIPYTNFKDTKKVNILLASLFTVCTVSITFDVILRDTGSFAAASLILIVGVSLFIPVLCQGFLFMPKLVPIICPKVCVAFVRPTPKSLRSHFHHPLSYSVSHRLI